MMADRPATPPPPPAHLRWATRLDAAWTAERAHRHALTLELQAAQEAGAIVQARLLQVEQLAADLACELEQAQQALAAEQVAHTQTRAVLDRLRQESQAARDARLRRDEADARLAAVLARAGGAS